MVLVILLVIILIFGSEKAREFGLIDENGNPYLLKRELVGGKLVISRALPVNTVEFEYILNNFLIGKFLDKENLALKLLHHIERRQ